MHVPLLGEVTALRAFFLFLFFYSNDSNSLGTWSTFGAGMLLSNLAGEMKGERINVAQIAPSFIITSAVIGYSAIYLDQMRMMIFLTLQSLIVPVYKHRLCRVEIVEGSEGQQAERPLGGDDEMSPGARMDWNHRRVLTTMAALTVGLYAWDGLSGLTSGTLFLIVLPEFTHRLPKFPALKTIAFYILILLAVAPIGVLVTGAMYFEKEMMEMPEQYKSFAKSVLGARPESVPDYYAIIGVRRGADAGEIKKAFRDLSKVYHPDKTAGNPELQEKFVKISEAARKLTGKANDRAAYYKELETAELTDMVTRSVYFVMLFGLWCFMTLMSSAGSKTPQVNADGTPQEQAPPVPPKPRVPMSRGQKLWLLLAVPVYLGWGLVEAHWANIDLFGQED